MYTVDPHSSEIWVLISQKPGDNNQSIALADVIGLPYVIKRLDWAAEANEERPVSDDLLRDTAHAADARRRLGLRAPWPRAVICCGRRAERFAQWIKRQSNERTKIFKIGRACRSLANYDLLIATPQFPVPPLRNVVEIGLPPTFGSPQVKPDLSPAVHLGIHRAFPKPWFTILLGGEVKQFNPSAKALKMGARNIQEAADRSGGSVLISTSRRTQDKMLSAITGGLTREPYIYRWSPEESQRNPYLMLLRESACIFVTADSISMMMDASHFGAPTFIIELPERFNLQAWWELATFKSLMAAGQWSSRLGAKTGSKHVHLFLNWMHRRGIARFPKDISRLHASLYARGLARPISAFDPSFVPLRFEPSEGTAVSPQLNEVAARCRALLDVRPCDTPRSRVAS
jgi:mitochondrial fission protein ELM1